MSSDSADSAELLRQTHEKSSRLIERIRLDRDDLASNRRIDSSVQQEGLSAIERVLQSLQQIARHSAVANDTSGPQSLGEKQ